MRRLFGLLLIIPLLTLGLAEIATAKVEAKRLVLDATREAAGPSVRILSSEPDRITLELTLPALGLEEFAIEDRLYQALTISGGGIRGEEGQPALPTISQLIAVPDGATLSARIVSADRQSFAGYRLFPVQPDKSDEFVIDRSYYNGGTPRAAEPELLVGEAGYIRHMRVLPLTFSPLGFDPASGEITVASRIEVEIELSGVDARESSAPALVPESFDRMYRDIVIGYERYAGGETGPGSYLLIYPNLANVLSTLQPLIDWRERQGYNVIAVSDAVTGTSTTSIKNYLQNAYNSFDPPLEYVVLVGDANGTYDIPTYTETLSGYYGEGDHYYSNLEGGDILSDVHLGRLSIRTVSELATIVDKIVTYETDPPTTDPGWFTRAGLAGDPSSSGITTIFVNQWVKSHLLEHSFTQIDTMWSPGAIEMRNSINQGMTVFGYRGYYGMSGMTTSYITNLTNGYELPFAVIVTCDTGSFKDDITCRSEAFLRAPNGGGIGSVATATIGTHTRYNNCYYVGNWDGAINGSDHRLGVAHDRGKLELYKSYQTGEPNRVNIWSVWMNLMGDPATDMWTAFPGDLTVGHPATVPVGANAIPVTVTSGGVPVAGARIALVKNGELSRTAYSDENGEALIPISGYSGGTLLVTVLEHDFVPYQGSVAIGTVSSYPVYAASTVDDDINGDSMGNNNGIVNPAESIELPVALQNFGTDLAASISATITTTDPYVTITDAIETFGDIPAGATVWSAEDFDFQVAQNVADGHVIALKLETNGVIQSWNSVIELTVQNADFEQESFVWGGSGDTLDPGESGSLTLTLRNNGSIAGNAISATLESNSPWVAVTDAAGAFGSIAVGNTGTNAGDTFALAVSPNCFEGHLALFTLTTQFNGQAQNIFEFSLQVGTASTGDPVGPDAYGYYAFDNTDTGYPYAPTYDWVEIAPSYGGSGTDLGLSDFGWQQDDTETVSLPFTFKFYGIEYDEISICSNGWVSMGTTSLKPYRNWSMPGAGGPGAMIAAYWDNLYQQSANKVYTWYDAANARYIVQWSRMRNDFSNALENFEVILYDPAVHLTPTGDGEIVVQFDTVNQTDSRDGYGTVGIQNMDRDDGLLYTYWNSYAAGAASLTSGRAIRFLPIADIALGWLQGDIYNATGGNTPLADVDIRIVQLNQTLISEQDGHYFGPVQAGDFTIRALHPSFETAEVPGVSILENETTELDFWLVDILGPYIENTTDLFHTDDTVGPYTVQSNITDLSAVEEAHFRFRLNGGPTNELDLTLIDAPSGLYRAQIPGYPIGTQVEYWFEAEDIAGNVSRDPADEAETYGFLIAQSLLVLDDDMEDDHGWTAGVPGDDATGGIWERDDPIGVWDSGDQVQPEDDFSPDGTLCFITGNNETGTQGADDVDSGQTTLLSPIFDLSTALGVTASYYRWYTNDTGNEPGQDYWIVQVSAGGENWIDLENTNVSERQWKRQDFLLEEYITLSSTVQFRFIAQDYGSGSIVEAGVDEFLLEGFNVPDATPAPDAAAPARLTLLQNTPNPFNPKTSLRFGLPASASVTLRIFDASGRLVRELLKEKQMAAGFHELTWDGRGDRGEQLSSGIYLYRVDTETQRASAKMTLIK